MDPKNPLKHLQMFYELYEGAQSLNLPTGDFCMTCIIKVANLAT